MKNLFLILLISSFLYANDRKTLPKKMNSPVKYRVLPSYLPERYEAAQPVFNPEEMAILDRNKRSTECFCSKCLSIPTHQTKRKKS